MQILPAWHILTRRIVTEDLVEATSDHAIDDTLAADALENTLK